MEQPTHGFGGIYTEPKNAETPGYFSVDPDVFGSLGPDPIQGFMVVEAHSAAITKGVIYPSSNAYNPCIFKPDGVILNEAKEG